MDEVILDVEREWRLPDFSHADDLVSWGEAEEGLKVMLGRFLEKKKPESQIRKIAMMVLGGEVGSVREILVDGTRMEHGVCRVS